MENRPSANLTGLQKTTERAPGVSRICFWESSAIVVMFSFCCKAASCVFEPIYLGEYDMSNKDLSDQDEGCEVIYRMTIRTKSGKVIRRANGQPFRIVIRRKP